MYVNGQQHYELIGRIQACAHCISKYHCSKEEKTQKVKDKHIVGTDGNVGDGNVSVRGEVVVVSSEQRRKPKNARRNMGSKALSMKCITATPYSVADTGCEIRDTSRLATHGDIDTPTGYAEKWAGKMMEAYRIANANTQQSSSKEKTHYDKKCKGLTLQPGDSVLVRNLNERGDPGKLRPYWEQIIYIVREQVGSNPVFKVSPETEGHPIRIPAPKRATTSERLTNRAVPETSH
ncbi:hypothetical protein F2P81_024038 [Scophthalmus maximus]|uniref:Uncharacterized protein n=1 Tax=Scophthalmus maximus TaxID=52904 RepID=A0A6A4RTM9_SCOMX|nr:hypothetical protein F2P81_024038 [Scophthalmus maximus]